MVWQKDLEEAEAGIRPANTPTKAILIQKLLQAFSVIVTGEFSVVPPLKTSLRGLTLAHLRESLQEPALAMS